MKRLSIALGIVLAVAGTVVLSVAAQANVNNFTFKDFTGDYYLSRDDEGRANLRVVETFTAEFPADRDQNKGITRAIPDRYEGNPTSFQFESLKRNGQTEPVYSQERNGDDMIIASGTEELQTAVK